MTMKINLLAADQRDANKNEEVMTFIAAVGGSVIGATIALTYIIAERIVGLV